MAIIDAARRPPSAFAQAGEKKNTWLVRLILAAVLCVPIGTGIAIYYFASVRPRLRTS